MAKLNLHLVTLIESPFSSGCSSSSSSSSIWKLVRIFRALTSTPADLTGSTWAYYYVLRPKDRRRQRSQPCGLEVAHLLISIIRRVGGAFKKSVFGDKNCRSICGPIQTLGLLRPSYTLLPSLRSAISAGRLEEVRKLPVSLVVRFPSMSTFSFLLLKGLDSISSKAPPPNSICFPNVDKGLVS